MQPLNLYVANVNDVRTSGKEGFNFPVKDATTIYIKGTEPDPLVINGNFVFSGAGVSTYLIKLGSKGIYKFNDSLNLANSGPTIGTIAYQNKVMSSKQIQIYAGNIPLNTPTEINLTGAIKLHILHDTSGDLFINGIRAVAVSGNGTIVIDIGNDIDIINDTIILETNSRTGYIVERLI